MSPYFHSAVPPKPETFSHRTAGACRYEDPCWPREGDPREQECPFRDFCESTAGGMQVPLTCAYGDHFRVTLSEPSSTPVVRSEHQYSKAERRRMSLRKHLYEFNIDRPKTYTIHRGTLAGVLHCLQHMPTKVKEVLEDSIRGCTETESFKSLDALKHHVNESFGALHLTAAQMKEIADLFAKYAGALMRCQPLSESDIFGRYLGFVDIRTNSPKSPLAMGLLVPPRSLRNHKDLVLITGEYSHLFGAIGFASTVYVMVDPDQGGAYCAQCCVIMVMAMLGDRGVTIAGAYTINHQVKRRIKSPGQTLEKFGIGGMRFTEINRALSPQYCGAQSHCMFFGEEKKDEYLAMRVIEAYLHSRCPVILLVASNKDLYPWKEIEDEVGHAVVIVGAGSGPKKQERSRPLGAASRLPRINELVLHDPSYKPFYRISFEKAVRASRRYALKHKRLINKILFVPSTTKKVQRRPDYAIREIYELAARPELGLKSDEAFYEKYFEVPMDESCAVDYRIALLHRDDIIEDEILPFVRAEKRAELRARIRQMPNTRYWVVSGYEQAQLEVVWIFDAETSETGQFLLKDCYVVPWRMRLEFLGPDPRVLLAKEPNYS